MSRVRLDSWKEIAVHLRRSVRTVQRWEQEQGLPIYRLDHNQQATVYAFSDELEQWMAARTKVGLLPADPEPLPNEAPESALPPTPAPPPPPRRHLWSRRLLLPSLGAGVAAVTIPFLFRSRPSPRRVVNETTRQTLPSISRDGNEIIWAQILAGKSSLHHAHPDSSRGEVVVPGTEPDRGMTTPRISPDGLHLAWIEYAVNGLWDIVVARRDGSQPLRIARADGASISWTADSQRLLFADRGGPDAPVAAHLVSVVDKTRWAVSKPAKGSWGDILVAASPDQEHFAVVRYVSPGDGDIYLFNWTGTFTRRLTQLRAWFGGFTFSPDGREIVFDSVVNGEQGLYRISTEGGDPRRIPTPGVISPRYPQVSGLLAGGKARLVFQNEIWISRGLRAHVNQRNLENVRFFSPLHTHVEKPCFGPDGTALAWTQTPPGGHSLWAGDAEGRNARLLHTFSTGVDDLAWSPDGCWLACTAWAAPKPYVWVVEVATGNARRLTDEPHAEGVPSWSRDGRWIYFRSDRDGTARFHRLPWPSAPGVPAKPEAITPAAIDGMEGPNGYFLFIETGQRAALRRVPLNRPETPEPHPNAPELRAGQWRVSADGLVYVDLTDSGRNTEIVQQQLRPPYDRKPLATLPLFPSNLVGTPAFAPGLNEIVWAQREPRDEVWMIDGFV